MSGSSRHRRLKAANTWQRRDECQAKATGGGGAGGGARERRGGVNQHPILHPQCQKRGRAEPVEPPWTRQGQKCYRVNTTGDIFLFIFCDILPASEPVTLYFPLFFLSLSLYAKATFQTWSTTLQLLLGLGRELTARRFYSPFECCFSR